MYSNKRKTTEEFIKEAEEKNSQLIILGKYVDSKTHILVKCKECGEEYMAYPQSILQGSIHRKCAKGKPSLSQEEFENMVFNNYENEYEILGTYTKMKSNILVKHNKCGYIWNVFAENLAYKHLTACPKCSNVKRITHEEYIQRLSELNPAIECIDIFKTMSTKIKHKCKLCGYVWDVAPSSLIGNVLRGCPMCKGGTNTVVIGVNDMWTTNPELAKLLANPEDGYKYSQGTMKKVLWKCPICGKISNPKSIHKVKERGFHCKACSRSISLPNRVMFNLLKQLNIKFEDEKYFDWCHFDIDGKDCIGVYDFYFELNNKKYIVEMDGGFHYKDRSSFISSTLEDRQFRDKQKDILAHLHNIEVIRIKCDPSTISIIKKNILKSRLNHILNLSNINWNKCFYDSTTLLFQDICQKYNEGFSITKLANEYNRDYSTIRNYLEYGTEIGICDYKRKINKKKIICINDQKIFESQAEASRYYNINVSAISNCCKGKRDNIKIDNEHYIFKYYNCA